MTAVTPKAALVTAYETLGGASASFASALTFGGRVRSIVSVTDIAVADSNGDIFHVTPIYSSWRLDRILVKNDAITGGTSYDLGIYTTAGVAVAVHEYASAVDMSTARTSSPIDLLDEDRDIALGAQAVWADAGQSSDPGTWYYLSYTANTAGSGAGQIVTRVHYVKSTS